MKVTTVEQMREMDRRATDEFGIADQILMENAGLAASAVIAADGVRGKSFVIVCGLGNNGGDGFVVARKLRSDGAYVRVFVLGDPEKYAGSSRENYVAAKKAGIEIIADASPEHVDAALNECDAIVDGLLGTGLTREVSGRYREVIEAINRSVAVVYALDIPSGIDGDTGAVRGVAVGADATITFGLPKLGNILYPGAGYGGELHATHISFPPALTMEDDLQVALEMPPPLPPRRPDGHKGSFGDVLFIAGASSYFGAPSLAALSLLKAGGGYSRLAAPRSVVPALAPLAPEVVFAPQDETEAGGLALSAVPRLLELVELVDFVVIGPGLGLEDETRALVRELVPKIDKPLLVDGDGLTAIAADKDVLSHRRAETLLTPHPGEMARLIGTDAGAIQQDRIGSVQKLSAELSAFVVLKTARSLVAHPDGRVFINPSGNSGMATAGSGDVLTGTVAAAYGLGLPVEDALRAGVFIHGLAGDLAAEEIGEDGVTARDILDHLPLALRLYREAYDELAEDIFGAVKVV